VRGFERRSDVAQACATASRWLDRALRRQGESRDQILLSAPFIPTDF